MEEQVTEPSEIKEERKKALKGNYQKAELINFGVNKTRVGECSDMASGGGTTGGGCWLHDFCGRIHCNDCIHTPSGGGVRG